MKHFILVLSLLVATVAKAQTVYTVGPGQQYLTLSQAYAAIPATISGPYELHLMPGYSSFSETFPIVFDARVGSSATNTITIIPQFSGATISTAADNTIEFNGCSHVIIDGSVAAAGDTANLKIINTNTTNNSILFDNGATNNEIRYCDLMGVYSSGNSGGGVIRFGETTSGNSNNHISYNVFHGVGANVPHSCVHSNDGNHANWIVNNYFYDYRNSAIRLKDINNDWQIIDNHAFEGQNYQLERFIQIEDGAINVERNYYGGTAAFATGIAAEGGRGFIYQDGLMNTVVNENIIRSFNGLVLAQDWDDPVIYCQGCLVSNNLIGDSTSTGNINWVAQESGEVTIVHAKNAHSNIISGINVSRSVSNASSVALKAVVVEETASNNRIGNESVPHSIWLDDIFSTSSVKAIAGSKAEGNVISNLHMDPSGSGVNLIRVDTAFDNVISNVNFNEGVLLEVFDDGNTCEGNVIENVNAAQFIFAHGDVRNCIVTNSQASSTLFGPSITWAVSYKGDLIGNYLENVAAQCAFYCEEMKMDSIYGNQVSNLTWNGTDDVYGFYLADNSPYGSMPTPSRLVIESNRVDSVVAVNQHVTGFYCDYDESEPMPLIFRSNHVESLWALSAMGLNISGTNMAAPDSIEHNYFGNFQADWAHGIRKNSNSSDLSLIADNIIENFNVSDGTVTGISCAGDITVRKNLLQGLRSSSGDGVTGIFDGKYVYNNIIRLGLDDYGTPTSSDGEIIGVYNYALSENELLFNTIYIDGSNVTGSDNTYCVYGRTTTTVTVASNILVNNRSNGQLGSGGHYTYGNEGSTLNQTVNYNLHFANGTGGALATFDDGLSSVNTLTDLQNVQIGQHLNSYVQNPNFVNADGSLTDQNMSPGVGSIAYGNGVYLPYVTEDFYGVTRSFTPTIGAIENGLLVGVQEQAAEESILLYPNPVKDVLTLESVSGAIDKVEIYNGLGLMVFSETGVHAQHKQIDLSQFETGVYVLSVKTEQGASRYKIVKE